MARRVLASLLLAMMFALTLPVVSAQTPRPVYSGNIQTQKYHNSACRYFSCKNCIVRFSSPQEARSAGYVACKVCGG